MTSAARDAEPQFSQPVRQIFMMLVVMGLVGTGTWFMMPLVWPVFLSSPYLNGFIAAVFVMGVMAGFWQVLGLISAVSWIEGFAMNRAGHEFVDPPRLLSSLATLLRSRSARMQISASSSKSILDSMATRLDETREITRYLINLLIFLGLLGTFYGLATTVPAVVETIRALAPTEGEAATDVFGRLMTGLEKQLGGMGTAFGSSLLGLAGSLVVGLLELFTGHAQNRFYRELEEWLSTITRVGFSSGDVDQDSHGRGYETDATAVAFHRVAESIEELHKTFIRAEGTQEDTAERIAGLTRVMQDLSKKLTTQQSDDTARKQVDEQTAILARIAASQDQVAALMQAQSEEAVDAESRMRLRSIDVQLLRILEEMSAGRQDTIAELRADLAAVDKSIRGLSRRPPQVPNPRDRG